MQISSITHLYKILKLFTMACRIHYRSLSFAHQPLYALALVASFTSASPSLPQASSYLDHIIYLYGPKKAMLIHAFLPLYIFPPLAPGLLHLLQGSTQTPYLPEVSHDSPVWTFGTRPCISITSLCLSLGSTRTGTVMLFSSSCVSSTCNSAWYKRALKLGIDWMNGWHPC